MKKVGRRLVRLGILLLAVRVLADLATPFLPGAFCFDPTASVQAAEATRPTMAIVVTLEPAAPARRTTAVHVPQDRRESRPVPHVRPFRSPILYLQDPSSSPAPDDD